MAKKYNLELTENQIRVVRDALEEYLRIRMNQWRDLADSLASKDVDFSSENPNHERIFDKYLDNRNAVLRVFECAGRILWEFGENQKTEDQLIAEDIWQVIRHELWKERGDKNTWCTDSYEPLRVSQEPLTEIKVLEE